ncbi:hypothetical protein DERF_003641 [Dermatophagoides farinae]|uniref:Secreted protein n=1 Tax=Dermatophagoides farinae TaxID=6954 RepID=A0A922IE44_DERFA|nr:hypothetical protein DERF_003641 [Dermatophagoides farinae]
MNHKFTSFSRLLHLFVLAIKTFFFHFCSQNFSAGTALNQNPHSHRFGSFKCSHIYLIAEESSSHLQPTIRVPENFLVHELVLEDRMDLCCL